MMWCKLGWHKWSEWQFVEHISVPKRESTHGSIVITHHGINGDYYDRHCLRCEKTEDRLDRSGIMTKLIKSGDVTE